MKGIFILLFISISLKLVGQTVEVVTPLNTSLGESSALIRLGGKLITLNDSGGESALYEIDTTSGNYLRKVTVSNATNVDWEELCLDNHYIYIGDFGNNDGSRTNLCIYRVSILDFQNTPNDTVTADSILFSYSNQLDFSPALYATNFDAEAFIAQNDSLYIFTKNWIDASCNVYSLPKTPGNTQAQLVDHINSNGLVTGATYDTINHVLSLIGYTYNHAFIIHINSFSFPVFSGGSSVQYSISTPESMQTEGIAANSINQFYVTAETHNSGNAALYRINHQPLSLSDLLSKQYSIYPNPVSNTVCIDSPMVEEMKLIDGNGKVVSMSKSSCMQLEHVREGEYQLEVKTNSQKTINRQTVIVVHH